MTAPSPDVEVYVDAPAAAVVDWVANRFGAFSPVQKRRAGLLTARGEICHDGQAVAVLIVEHAADRYTSLLFDSAALPWPDDAACARELAAALNCEVRCNSVGWQPDQHDDEGWLSVTVSGERAVRWQIG